MREKLLMNRDWLFYYGEPAFKDRKNTSQDQVYRGSRGQNARGPARRDFLDYDWRTVQLPHDFVYEHGQTRDNPCSKHGNFPADRGSAWYRKYFKLDEADKGKRITLVFDGVSTRCEVYVNSMLLAANRTAGIGFEVDITEVALFGTEFNEVSVHADCHDYEAWYYEGGGIYRDVWLVKTDNLCVDLWGTYVRANRKEGKLWQLDIDTEVLNNYYEDKNAVVVSTVFDTKGKEIAKLTSEETLCAPQETTIIKQSVNVNDPVLWWDRQINELYLVKTEIMSSGEVVDTYETKFGFREITFDPEKGMFLNGRPTTVYGFSNHQKYHGVGNAMSDSMMEFYIRSVADMGGNGYRTVHSPHGEAIYEACDKYGLLMMDENRVFHPSKFVIDEVARMVKRDRNHPSILFYSMYNEEDLMATPVGKRIYKKLAAKSKQLDPMRPVSGATSYGMFTDGAHEDHDLFGVNHQTNNFDALHAIKPNKPLYCSEMVAPLSRDLLFHPSRHAEDARQLEKEFAWGGFQFTAWGTGTYDQQGGKSNVTQGFKAYLKKNEPLADIMPGWNFPGKEGKEVMVYLPNNGDYVEVSVNGKFIAKLETDYFEITPLKLTYEPGEIKVVAYKDGKVWAEGKKVTPGEAAGVKLVLENPSLKADDRDVAIVTAYIVDKDGNHVDHEFGYPATITSNEAGEYINAIAQRRDRFEGITYDPVSFEMGKLQAFFRSMDTEGDLIITIDAPGLGSDTLTIKREHTGKGAVVETVPNNYIMDWQISELFPNFMDENAIMKRHEVNTWEHIDTQGSPDVLYQALPPLFGFGPCLYPAGTSFNYAYYTKVRIPDLGAKKDGEGLGLFFEGIDGKANIVVTNGKKTARGHHPGDSPWPGHYKPEMKMLCEEFEAGEEVEIWAFIYYAKRITGIAWPVRFIYTTAEEVRALEEKTAREWNYCKTLNKD
ncbi:MAG: DUF4982 domain-containing protein [Christensenellaceae bacterium]|nr:DUF4982 domain-containing protein [Christensenellaceae bacterium]